MNSRKHCFLFAVLLTLVSFLSLQSPLQAKENEKNSYKKLDTFAQALHIVEQNYVVPADREALVAGALKGMLQALDPHSAYFTAEEKKEFDDNTAGRFVGIGVEIGIKSGKLTVIAPLHGGPAQKAGIQPGDVIVALDDVDVREIGLDALFKRMRGEPGSMVKLTVLRPHQLEPLTFRIERGLVATESVTCELLENAYAHVIVRIFDANVAEEVLKKLELLEKSAQNPLKGILLDLRNNPGGLLQEGVLLANYFVRSGTLVTMEGRANILIKKFEASALNHKYDLPVVVLINEGSASASEIVAGAIQDHKRGVIVGMPSFGKASVQNIFPLADGSAVKLTFAKYYTPNHRSIQALGIQPDVQIPLLKLTNPEIAYKTEKDLDRALENNEAGEPKIKATNDMRLELEDIQLFVALQQLKANYFLK